MGARKRRVIKACVAAAAAVGIALGWQSYRASAGEPSEHLSDAWHEGHRVLDRRGNLLRELSSEAGQRGRSLPLEAVGERLVLATIVSEDKSFFDHEGVDPAAIARAVTQNVRHARLVSGASTITQQLVKLLDHEGKPHPRGLAVKLREAARAQNLEQVLEKNEILEAYLNRLSYGRGLVGPEAAAQGYFGVASRDLSHAQAAFLAVLPRAPSYLDPYAHKDRVLLRQRALLAAMREAGALDEASYARAESEPIAIRPFVSPFLAPHFVESLRQEGKLTEGSATVTSLDVDLQVDVEGLVRTHLAAVAEKGATNAAVIVADNATGEVLSYVGSADFHDEEIAGQVDMARALRQPGSTLKPFVYALAFERGHDGAEMLADVPTSFSEAGRGAYAPSNFHGIFEGPISAREALAGSLNVPVVRLASELGPDTLLTSLRSLGFASLDREADHYGLALSLGSGEVRLREVAAAYVALARGGEAIPLAPLGSAAPKEGTRVMAPEIAASIAEILSDPLARVRGLHGQGPFDVGFPVAVKTGTSSGFRDTWSAGYTRERTVVVWVGNADGSPMRGLTGASGAGPLFADVMRRAMRDVPARAPLWDADLLVTAEVCPLSGKLPGPACPDHAVRRFARGHAPGEACGVHVKAQPKSAGPGEAPFRCSPEGRVTIAVFPDVFSDWLSSKPSGAPGHDAHGTPWFLRSSVEGCEPDAAGPLGALGARSASAAPGVSPAELRVESPAPGSVFLLSPSDRAENQQLEVTASLFGAALHRPTSVEFLLDGKVVARSPWPYRARIQVSAGDHEILALPSDPSLPVRIQGARFRVLGHNHPE
jgi:penicillin-binding protein 1C